LSIERKSFLSKESDIEILQNIYFVYEVGITSSYSNRAFPGLLPNLAETCDMLRRVLLLPKNVNHFLL